jgi:hypothetical protein
MTADTLATAAAILRPELRAIWDLWHRLPRTGPFPAKSAFSPHLPPPQALPRLFLIDIGATGTFRVRLMGTYLVSALGRDFTGQPMDERTMPGFTSSVAHQLLTAMQALPRPLHYLGPTSFRTSDHYRECEMVLLPLVDAMGVVAHAIGAIDYLWIDGSR